MRYLSDNEENKALVKALMFDSVEGKPRDGWEEALNQAIRTSEDLVALAKVSRKRFEEEVLYKVELLAIWKAFSSSFDWQEFLAHLANARIPVRQVDSMKRLIDAQFETLLKEAQQDRCEGTVTVDPVMVNNAKMLRIEHVKTCAVEAVGGGLTVTIQLRE